MTNEILTKIKILVNNRKFLVSSSDNPKEEAIKLLKESGYIDINNKIIKDYEK